MLSEEDFLDHHQTKVTMTGSSDFSFTIIITIYCIMLSEGCYYIILYCFLFFAYTYNTYNCFQSSITYYCIY